MLEKPKPPTTIDGERIQLRARSRDQAPEMFALIEANRDHLRPWMPWESTTLKVEDSLAYIDFAIEQWNLGKTYDYSLYEKSSGLMIGSFGLHSLKWDKETCDLGYWISKSHEGRGYISEAVRLAEETALELGMHRLVITCDRNNARSRRIPSKLHYKLESLQIDETIDRGRWRDTLRFVKLLNPPIEGHITENLPRGFSICHSSPEEFWQQVEGPMRQIFHEDQLTLNAKDVMTEDELRLLKDLSHNFKHAYQQHSLLWHQGSLAGWTWGYQDSRESFYMVNSAILPEHRGRGLYSALLRANLKLLKEKGFQRIWSRHHLTNNEVIIAKLKQEFQITGSELHDTFGTLVHLTYFSNETRRKVLKFRAGQARPDPHLKSLLQL